MYSLGFIECRGYCSHGRIPEQFQGLPKTLSKSMRSPKLAMISGINLARVRDDSLWLAVGTA